MMDALNVDWCLTCNKQASHGKPYCSRSCKARAVEAANTSAGEFSYFSDDASSSSDVLREPPSRTQRSRPSGSSRRYEHSLSSRAQQEQRVAGRRTPSHYHAAQQQFVEAELYARSQWPGYNNAAGIRDWLRDVPTGCPSIETPSIGPSLASSYAKPSFPLSRQRPAGPALCTDTTQPARTSLRSSSPISLPSPRGSQLHDSTNCSYSTHSLFSALNESPIPPEPLRGRGRTKTHVRAENTNKPTVLDGFARRIRAWGAGSGAPVRKLKYDAPAQIYMETTTTTVPASPSPSSSSPSSPIQRSNTTKSNPKSNASGFTVRASTEGCEPAPEPKGQGAVFDLRVPLANARSPLVIHDFELKESLAAGPKRGIWIAGREKADAGPEQFGPAHYEKGWRDGCAVDEKRERAERELREFEAWRARGRKPVRL